MRIAVIPARGGSKRIPRKNIKSFHCAIWKKDMYKHLNKWNIIKQVRRVITGALEKKRADKIIGSSLEAHIDIYLEDIVDDTNDP